MSTNEILGFEWDEANRQKSLRKHNITWIESEQVFFNEPLLIDPDIDHSTSEQRFRALGRTNTGKSLFICFTIRRGFIRIISARPMSRLERKIYEESI